MMRWTFIDAIYFAMTTISTVGYGDLSVALDSGWMVTFTVLYIMGGFVIAFPRLTAAVTFVIQPFFDVMAEAIERTFPQRAIDIDGNGDYDYKIPRHPLIYYSKGLLGPLITFVLVQCLFSALFIWIEPDWDHYGIAYYHCMVTASTVGYGDLTIVTQRGKLLAFFHIFVSVSLLAAMLSDLDGLRTRRASELRRGQQFLGRLNVDNIMSLDTDGTGVDMFEFVVGMLLKLDYVNCETVQGFVAQFQALDTSGDGILQRNELERYVALQRDIIRKCSSLDHRQIERLGGLIDEKERDEAARSNLSEALGRTVLNHTGRSRSVFSSSSRQPSILSHSLHFSARRLLPPFSTSMHERNGERVANRTGDGAGACGCGICCTLRSLLDVRMRVAMERTKLEYTIDSVGTPRGEGRRMDGLYRVCP